MVSFQLATAASVPWFLTVHETVAVPPALAVAGASAAVTIRSTAGTVSVIGTARTLLVSSDSDT